MSPPESGGSLPRRRVSRKNNGQTKTKVKGQKVEKVKGQKVEKVKGQRLKVKS
jgi:hypothetical protein